MFIEIGRVCILTGCLRISVWWNKVPCWALMAASFVAVVEYSLRFSGLSTLCSCISCIYSSEGVRANFYMFLSAEAKYSKILKKLTIHEAENKVVAWKIIKNSINFSIALKEHS